MIELRNVTKIYKNGKEALSGLNLTINTGEICFIVGESGAGKSTLVKLLLMEEKATEGPTAASEKSYISQQSVYTFSF